MPIFIYLVGTLSDNVVACRILYLNWILVLGLCIMGFQPSSGLVCNQACHCGCVIRLIHVVWIGSKCDKRGMPPFCFLGQLYICLWILVGVLQ